MFSDAIIKYFCISPNLVSGIILIKGVSVKVEALTLQGN